MGVPNTFPATLRGKRSQAWPANQCLNQTVRFLDAKFFQHVCWQLFGQKLTSKVQMFDGGYDVLADKWIVSCNKPLPEKAQNLFVSTMTNLRPAVPTEARGIIENVQVEVGIWQEYEAFSCASFGRQKRAAKADLAPLCP